MSRLGRLLLGAATLALALSAGAGTAAATPGAGAPAATATVAVHSGDQVANPAANIRFVPRFVFAKGIEFCTAKACLIMQSDGNFVLYDENGRARWATNTVGRGAFAAWQTDGNLVVYNGGGGAIWASNTCCHSGYNLLLQDDGNLVIYDGGGHAVWATHTNH
ncbi:MAG: hypothetical protein ACJ73S_00715 [Mycobacteriales bacterium]